MNGHLVVRQVEEKTISDGGIELLGSGKEQKLEGEVIAVSDHLQVSVGDTIVFKPLAGSPMTIEGEDYLIMQEQHVYAVIG